MAHGLEHAKTLLWSFKKQMIYTKESEHACINTKKQIDGRRNTLATTPVASHTVTAALWSMH